MMNPLEGKEQAKKKIPELKNYSIYSLVQLRHASRGTEKAYKK